MLERLLECEHDWFLAINGAHTWWMDHLMYAFSSLWAWLPLIIVPLCFLLKRRAEWIPMTICIILTVLLNGLVTSLIFKPLFARPRPTGHPLFMDKIRILNNYIASGEYGFISGHTTNAFAFCVLTALIIRTKGYTVAVLTWAILMACSRIYLAAHFISDVIPGILAGALIGWGLYELYQYLVNRQDERLKTKN